MNMNLLYKINKRTANKSCLHQEIINDEQPLCSLSSRNILAFTTTADLDDVKRKTWGYHVYVCDINTPWNAHKILTNKSIISALKWDLSGEKLAVADSTGMVQLWALKEHILNDWVLVGSSHFHGEQILGLVWFHNGKKTHLVAEKKDSIQYNEKFSNSPYAPSVKQFGGRAAQGVFMVSNTGMLGAMIITQDFPSTICCASESIGSMRQKINAVDISYAKNGQFLVAISSGSVSLPIRCFRVSVRKTEDRCHITSQALPSFFLQDGASSDDYAESTITNLKFVSSEKVDSLIVGASNNENGLIEVWELSEKTQPVHKSFQSKTCDPFKTVVWQPQAMFQCSSSIAVITTTKLSIVSPTSYILVALSDSTIQCFSHDNLKTIATTSLKSSHDEPVSKYMRTSSSITCIDMSSLGCAFTLVDTLGAIYLYRLFPENSPITLTNACTLLEYSLLTGLDWLDLLFCLHSNMIEALIERFDASFNRQPMPIQQHYYMKYLCIKNSLYRMLISGQSKAADLSALFMVHSIAAAFKSLLRPSDSFHDKVPAERLPSVLTENMISDVDKVLLHIEPKEFTVEPTTLQSLQQLMQWIADLALNLLVRIPEQRMQLKSSGFELLKDHKALNIIRELLVVIRIWGLLRHSCLPVYSKSADNIDVLGLLFQHLSKLVQPVNGDVQQIDDQLIDDCCLLPNQIMIPLVCQAHSITAIATPLLCYQNIPLQLEFGSKPDLNFVPELNPVEGCMQYDQTVDTVRHIYLGKKPFVAKRCTRCGAKSQIQNSTRTAAIKSWEQRWVKNCPCGGIWEVHNVA